MYQLFISPLLGPRCKYLPTCSVYSIDSLKSHGFIGIFYALRRICSCHPFSAGGYDPVPPKNKNVLLKDVD